MSGRGLVVNMLANWGGQTLVAIVGLIVTPLIIARIGVEQYGLLTLAASVTSQLILFDLGISTSLTRQLPFHRTRNSRRELQELLASGGFLLATASMLIVFTMFWAVEFLPGLFHVAPPHDGLFRVLLWIYTADVAIEVFAGLFVGMLGGMERFVLLNQLNVARSLTNAGACIVVLLSGGGAVGVALTALFTRLVHRVTLAAAALRSEPVSPARLSRSGTRAVLAFGVWIGLAHLATRIINQVDPLVVGLFLGATAAGWYAPALMISEQLRLLAQLACAPLTPRMSSLCAAQRYDEARSLLLTWIETIQILLGALTVPILLHGGEFLVLWLGPEFGRSGIVLSLLTGAAILFTPAGACASYLYAAGRQADYAKLLAGEAVLNLGLSLVLVRIWGAPGVALGTLAATCAVGALALPKVTARSIGLGARELYSAGYVRPLPYLGGYALLLLVLNGAVGVESWGRFWCVHVGAGLAYLALVIWQGVLRRLREARTD